MKTIKVSEATPIQLDWLVAKCEGANDEQLGRLESAQKCVALTGDMQTKPFTPSTDWAQGGPLIEREKIDLEFMDNFEAWCGSVVREYGQDRESYSDDQDRESYTAEQESFVGYGPTPLIAVCRCYVASKMGDVVEVPSEHPNGVVISTTPDMGNDYD